LLLTGAIVQGTCGELEGADAAAGTGPAVAFRIRLDEVTGRAVRR
jgi:hypothetical protein